MDKLISKVEVKAKVYEYIKQQGGVSYVELERFFESIGYSYQGTEVCCSSMSQYVVFWEGWHKQAYSILNELIKDKKIHREPAPMWVYLVDGKGLALPIVTETTNYKRIKREYWLPCVFSVA